MRHKGHKDCHHQLNYRNDDGENEDDDDCNCDDYPLKNAPPPSPLEITTTTHIQSNKFNDNPKESDQLQIAKVECGSSSSSLNDANHQVETHANTDQQQQVVQSTQLAIKEIHNHQIDRKHYNQLLLKQENKEGGENMPSQMNNMVSPCIARREAENSQALLISTGEPKEIDNINSGCKILTDLDDGEGILINRNDNFEVLQPQPYSPVSGRESMSPPPIKSRVIKLESSEEEEEEEEEQQQQQQQQQKESCMNNSEISPTLVRCKKLKKSHHSNRNRRACKTIAKFEVDSQDSTLKTTIKTEHGDLENEDGGNRLTAIDRDSINLVMSPFSTVAADEPINESSNGLLKLEEGGKMANDNSNQHLLYTTTTDSDYTILSRQQQVTINDADVVDDDDDATNDSTQSNHTHHQHIRKHRQIKSDSQLPAKLTEQQIEQIAYLINIIRKGNYNEFMELLEKQNFKRSLLNVFVNGHTALHYSLLYGRSLAWCKQLVLSGANPNLTNRAGWHPVHLASYSCSNETMRYLLDCLSN